MKKQLITALIPTLFLGSLQGQTIQEKKESFFHAEGEIDRETQAQLEEVNGALSEKRHTLKLLYEKVAELYKCGACTSDYKALLEEISLLKSDISEVESMWRDETATLLESDSYALWHQPDTSILQLVMDYGAQEFVYLVPPEIGAIRLSMSSNLPIPRQSWGECLELILSSHGIGVRQLNPFLRELFFLRQDPSGLKAITNAKEDLESLPSSSRICFVLASESPDPKSTLYFLQKFSNPATTSLQIIGGQICIISSVESIKELLKLYSFVQKGHMGQDFQLIKLSKIDPREMETILFSAFQYGQGPAEESSSLRVFPLNSIAQSLFLSGPKEEVSKAIKLIRDVEAQIENPQEKTVFWYTVKHSEAEELATVLAKVYDLLLDVSFSEGKSSETEKIAKVAEEARNAMVVKPAMIAPLNSQRTSHKTADGRNNFIVDAKTGSIIMVVEQEALPKIKELLKKLDVPKKMVQIEVLLFEKKVSSQTKFGLNLLRLGESKASNLMQTGVAWTAGGPGAGILEFLISRGKGSGIPAYDLAYHFLLGQDDVQINASPSITTVNQTPATIAIVEEISINTGNLIEKDKEKSSYSRAQYGITMQITPTINSGEEDLSTGEQTSFITLDTDITFDTTQKSSNERPDVTRRHIKNHVRIADGQTVIIGGLRRKNAQDSKDSIPFLGEIPGIGKLFSTTEMSDSNTEMFIFITPKIIADPLEDAERMKWEELRKRPGDVPLLVHEIGQAKDRQRKKLFEGSLKALFGRQDSFTTPFSPSREYEGR